MQKENLKVVVLLPKTKRYEILDKIKVEVRKYFNVELIVEDPKKIKNHINSDVDVLVMHAADIGKFQNDYYRQFKDSNKHFKFVVIKMEEESTDFDLYKKLVDDIIYINNQKNAIWKTIAVLRRYWSTYSKPTTIIYKNIIADFIDQNVFVNNKEVALTTKELQLFKFFILNKGKFISKQDIFMKVWGYEEDTSRAFDQMIFKLKNKIGKDYFKSSRTKGYKFE